MPKCDCQVSKSDWRLVYTKWYSLFLVLLSIALLILLYTDMYGSLFMFTLIMSGAIFISGIIYIYATITLIDEWRSKQCQCMKLSQSLMYIWAIIKGILYVEAILILLILFNSISATSKYFKRNLKKLI